MDSEKEKRPAKERSAKQAKEPRPAREPKEQREKKEQRRRERPIEASEVFVAAEESANDVFRKRLTYLMNGNNPQGKAVNIQELADAVGVSRPAIRKYLKPKGRAHHALRGHRLRHRALFRHHAGFPAGLRHAGHGGRAQSAGERLL